MVEQGLAYTHACAHAHTHAHALWSRQAQTTGTHVERVSEQTFIPALSRSMSKLTRSNFVCQFSALARQHRQLCNHKKPFTCNKHDSLGCFLSCLNALTCGGFLFVCSATSGRTLSGWPVARRGTCKPIWPFSTCPTH